MILKCWYIAEWMEPVDKLGQQEAVMVVIINKVATRQGLWQASIGRHFNLLKSPHCQTVHFQSEKSPTLCIYKLSLSFHTHNITHSHNKFHYETRPLWG